MYSLTFHETKQHGTLEFPVEYVYVDASHPRYNMPFHWHKEWELIHVIEGTFTVHADNMMYTAQEGDTLLIRDGMLHGGTPDNCVYTCFLFDLHGLFRNLDMVKKYLRPIYRQQILPHIFYPADLVPEIKNMAQHLIDAYRLDTHNQGSKEGHLSKDIGDTTLDNPLELIVISCISQLFTFILQQNLYTVNQRESLEDTHKIDLIKSVLEYIELHYASPISLDDLANVAGMNPKYFCRFFRSITYQTPMSYVNMYRIEKAAQMLHSTRLPVTDICMECGFNDSSNFIKVFRKYKGMTPLQYQRVDQSTSYYHYWHKYHR